MSDPLYPSWSNAVYRGAIALMLVGVGMLVVGPMLYVRTPYNTSQFVPWEQPVDFDHRHHVRDAGIACLYCHAAAERSRAAGVPTTGVCMGCHAQIWPRSPLLAPVRRSYFTGTPIRWRRVHDLPDFVYFDHAVHVTRGIDCSNCHGDVGAMARVVQVQPLTMGWCLDCHRDSAARVATPPIPTSTWSAALAMFSPIPSEHLEITKLTTCSACHR